MAWMLRPRRGTTTQNASLVGGVGEVTVDTTKSTIRVHDGSTTGGTELARTSDVPTKVSQLTNDSGYLTTHQDLSAYALTSAIPTKVSQLTNDSSYATTTALTNGLAGKLASKPAAIELTPSTSAGNGGYIDFHYNGSTADYTARILESASGVLSITARGGLYINDAKYAASGAAASADTYVTEAYTSGANGYIVLSNKLIVQWGAVSCGTNNFYTATLAKAYTGTSYVILASCTEAEYDDAHASTDTRTTTSFRVRPREQGDYCTVHWVTIGT